MKQNDRKVPSKYYWWLAGTAFFLAACTFAHGLMTQTLGIALVDMVSVPKSQPDKLVSNITRCNRPVLLASKSNSTTTHSGQFNWDATTQANIIAIHDWINLGLLPVSGFLVSFWNPSVQLGIMTALAAVGTAVLPPLAKQLDYTGVMISRGLLGLCHAITSPAIDAIVARDVSPTVRSTVYALISGGSGVAGFVGLPLATVFITQNILGGWAAIFYVSSIIAFVWATVWLVFLAVKKGNLPTEQNSSSSSLGHRDLPYTKTEYLKTLYNEVLKHPAIWAIFPCNIAATFTTRLLTYYIPQYYNDVFHLPLMNNAIVSSLPYVVMTVAKLGSSALADMLKLTCGFSPNIVAKSFNTAAFVGSGVCILLTTLIPCMDDNTAIALITVGACIYACSTPGYALSYTSISTRWAGVVSALCTVISMVAGITFPYIVSAATVSDQSERGWHIVFIVVFVFDVLAALVFLKFGSVANNDRPLSNLDARRPLLANSTLYGKEKSQIGELLNQSSTA